MCDQVWLYALRLPPTGLSGKSAPCRAWFLKGARRSPQSHGGGATACSTEVRSNAAAGKRHTWIGHSAISTFSWPIRGSTP